jgi:hypothetical protein
MKSSKDNDLQRQVKRRENVFVIAPLETPAKNKSSAEKKKSEKIEKEVCRAVEDAIEKST